MWLFIECALTLYIFHYNSVSNNWVYDRQVANLFGTLKKHFEKACFL